MEKLFEFRVNPIIKGEVYIVNYIGQIICRLYENDYIDHDDPKQAQLLQAQRVCDALIAQHILNTNSHEA
jgi:hypothetical protein